MTKGTVAVWLGRLMYFGSEVSTGLHRHRALQIAISLGRPLRVRSMTAQPFAEQQSFIVCPDVPHQMEGTGEPIFLLYCESQTLIGVARALSSQTRSPTPALPLPAIEALLPFLRSSGGLIQDETAGETLFSHIFSILTGSASEEGSGDPRIAAAQTLVTSKLLKKRTGLTELLAESVHLSPSRFRHLFRDETGVSVQGYVLWKRLITALLLHLRGQSLTTAAQTAGFADSAHLSRACLYLFGVQPSRLFKNLVAEIVMVGAELGM